MSAMPQSRRHPHQYGARCCQTRNLSFLLPAPQREARRCELDVLLLVRPVIGCSPRSDSLIVYRASSGLRGGEDHWIVVASRPRDIYLVLLRNARYLLLWSDFLACLVCEKSRVRCRDT